MNLALSGTRGVSISKSAMYLKRLPYELRTHRSWIVVPWDAFKWNPIEPRMRQLQLTYINLTVTVLAKTILCPLRWCDLGLKNRVSSSRQHRLRGAETEIMSVIFSVLIQGNENICARFVFISRIRKCFNASKFLVYFYKMVDRSSDRTATVLTIGIHDAIWHARSRVTFNQSCTLCLPRNCSRQRRAQRLGSRMIE